MEILNYNFLCNKPSLPSENNKNLLFFPKEIAEIFQIK